MNQLSSVLTILAVVWSACMLPAAIAVFQFHSSKWFLVAYAMFGLMLFLGIGVLRVLRRSKDRRRAGKEK